MASEDFETTVRNSMIFLILDKFEIRNEYTPTKTFTQTSVNIDVKIETTERLTMCL